ncbi:helix-turn-helix transcriptional regulator [Haloferula rosea]|uniref:WYL domain-containing protein n=1 Tax=Haloferula rosea TaxID=490093 RepID=A0A934RA15_9BACT|nr:WYL domain-containing protein [Haloferula rosea]MBK1825958.1 WYL domain-containing protein [Haloferula rosea]
MARFREEVVAAMGDGEKHTRRPFERMHRIHEAIAEGRLPNCSSLAKELEVTPKTVQRDITFMRDSFRLPLVYDKKRHGFYYEGEVDDFPDFEIGAEEIAAMFLARTAADAIRGTELADKMRAAFGRLCRSMSERVELNWADLDEAFSRKVPQLPAREVKLFGELAEAVVKRLEVSFHYRKLGADRAEARRVHPLHLGEVDGGWYLIGHDEDRGALRTFALPRITRLKVSGRRFDPPADFDGREYLRRSFGVWTVAGDDSLTLVQVKLSDYAARLARERRWHPTQEVRELNAKGTKVEVCFEAGSLEEVVRWVLSFGSKAQVVGPPELKRMVKEEVKLMGG